MWYPSMSLFDRYEIFCDLMGDWVWLVVIMIPVLCCPQHLAGTKMQRRYLSLSSNKNWSAAVLVSSFTLSIPV